MIDTISIYQKGINGTDFNINSDKFYVTTSPQKEGMKPTNKYYNTFYEDVKKKTKAINIQVDSLNNYSLLTFSVPKLVYGNSLETFKLEDSEKVFDILENRLKKIYEADFRNMQVSRLDVTKNIQVKDNTSLYIDALKEAVSENKRYKVTKYNAESIVIANKSKRFTLYDKIIESIKENELSRSEAKKYGNVLRMEAQHKKAQHIENAFSRKMYFSDLFTEGSFAEFKNYLVTFFDNSFCNYGQYELFMEDIALIDVVSSISKRNVLKNFLITKHAEDIEFNFKHFEDLLKHKGYSRPGISKAIKEIEKLRYLVLNKVSDVIEEVRFKLVA